MKGVFDYLLHGKAEAEENGEKFENFIMKHFSRSREFKIVEGPQRYVRGVVSESIKKPDLGIRHLSSGKEFYVECKWRSRWEGKAGSEKISLIQFKPQLLRHKSIQKESRKRVFLALGIGKLVSVDNAFIPLELYFVPLDMIYDNFSELRKEYLIKYQRDHFVFPTSPQFNEKKPDLK